LLIVFESSLFRNRENAIFILFQTESEFFALTCPGFIDFFTCERLFTGTIAYYLIGLMLALEH